jgi:hypothetical protein
MFHAYIPTIEAPTKDSPEWYKRYHTSFYLSQLVNNLLLSYLRNFIEIVQHNGLIKDHKEELLACGALIPAEIGEQPTWIKNDEKFYSVDIKICLQELLDDFRARAVNMHRQLLCSGVQIDGYLQRTVDVDLDKLLSSAGTNDWYEVVKGFLNVWEFLFIFSITESALKEAVNDKNVPTTQLVSCLLKKHPQLEKILLQNHELDGDFCRALWTIYVEIRNLYSHTHGAVSPKDKNRIEERAAKFRDAYQAAFHEKDPILSPIMPKPCVLFPPQKIQPGKFFFMSDPELNIFRNFISEFCHELSQVK